MFLSATNPRNIAIFWNKTYYVEELHDVCNNELTTIDGTCIPVVTSSSPLWESFIMSVYVYGIHP